MLRTKRSINVAAYMIGNSQIMGIAVTCPPKISPGRMLDFGLKERGIYYRQVI